MTTAQAQAYERKDGRASVLFNRARRLGYLRLDYAGRLAGLWEAFCFQRRLPCIWLYPTGRSMKLAFSLPPGDPFDLTEAAVQEITRTAEACRLPGSRAWSHVGPRSGEIGGLAPEAAEQLAFRLTEFLSDPARFRRSPSWA
jgi:hypothetical protein